MVAIDSNVVVRFLTGDDPAQARRAKALIEAHEVLVPSTVLLETEWVLRGAYDLERSGVISALAAFAGLPNVKLREPDRVARALEWAGAGVDFADALHLAAADACHAFVTFDRRLVKLASRIDGTSVREP